MCGIADAQQTVGELASGLIAANIEKLHIIELDLADVCGELRIGVRDCVTQRCDALGPQALVRTLRNEAGDLHVAVAIPRDGLGLTSAQLR